MLTTITDELRAQLRASAASLVAAGFDPAEQIASMVADQFCDEVPAETARTLADEAKRATADALESHKIAQASWAIPTDCDRLDRAFRALSESGICARQHFTCCQTCGHAEIGDELAPGDRGYVFYHWQDTESAVEGQGLFLAYGAVKDGVVTEEVGRQIVEALAREGLRSDWNGSVESRIHVALDWKRRR